MGQVNVSEVASGNIPSSGNVGVYAKADGLLYQMDDAGLESLVTTPAYLLQPRKNLLINGAFAIAQRASSANPTGSAFSVTAIDRMGNYVSGSTGNFTWARQPTGLPGSPYCGRLSRNATSATTGRIYQILETIDSQPLAGRTVTFSFKARCSSGFTPSASQITAYIISGTGADQSGTSLAGGSWTGQANAAAVAKTLTTSWQQFSVTGVLGSTVTQVAVALMATFVGTGSDHFETCDWQLEVGETATDFDWGLYALELQLCRRYYESTGQTNGAILRSVVASSSQYLFVPFSVRKRVVPTMVLSEHSAANVSSTSGPFNTTIFGFEFAINVNASGANGGAYKFFNFTADAEL